MKDGDFIRLDFNAFVKETEQLVDTTSEEVAREHDVYNERVTYKPIAVVVGSGHVVKGLDMALLGAEVGKETKTEIEPVDAFGEKDPKLVDVFPMNKVLSLPEFRKGDQYPVEGMELRINNRIGFISRIFAGRVRIDFNNRWAGKTIVYDFTIKETIEDKEQRLKAIIEAAYANPDEFQVEFKGDDEVDIILPDMVKLDQSWAMSKFKLVSDLRAHLGLRTVRLIEEYVKKEEEIKAEEEHAHDEDHGTDEKKEEEIKAEEKPTQDEKKAEEKKE
ncbi:MAG: FKBP-type peptidyl-prolyl cis-trans isomerase [Candidatus Thermoplasmatota archaeon]|nr:FKBP-type peptidyl-prolyl cis-trans isomerase [Candidatus Thermoplasmatota archaeon]